MNRRGFIQLLGGAAALAATGRTIFLPPAGGWPASQLAMDAHSRALMNALVRSMMHTKDVMAANLLTRGYSYTRLHYEDEEGRVMATDVTDDFYRDMAFEHAAKTQHLVI